MILSAFGLAIRAPGSRAAGLPDPASHCAQATQALGLAENRSNKPAGAQQNLKLLLVGSWLHRATIMGDPKDSVVTYFEDGTFREDPLMGAPPEGSEQEPIKIHPIFGRRGQWVIREKPFTIEHFRIKPDGTRESETRTIVLLTADEFVSTDQRFGIAVRQVRIPRPIYVDRPK